MPKKYMMYGIIFIVLAVAGYFVYNNNMKTPQVVETRDFSCPGMTGFTFKYPMFKDTNFVLAKMLSTNSENSYCELQFSKLNSPTTRETVTLVTVSMIYIINKASVSPPPRFTNKNSNDLLYYQKDNEVEFWLNQEIGSEVIIELASGQDSIKNQFFQTVIESFKLTK